VNETSWLIETHLGPEAEASFLRSISSSGIAVEQLSADELVATYADLPLGALDASVVATAERLSATTLLTLDRRHFSIVRPSHTGSFLLLP
jgi:hypothetical protein